MVTAADAIRRGPVEPRRRYRQVAMSTSPAHAVTSVGAPPRPWPGHPDRAHVVLRDRRGRPLDDHNLHAVLADGGLEGWLDGVRRAGYRAVRTNAVHRSAGRVLESFGFEVVQELALLRRRAPDTPVVHEPSTGHAGRAQVRTVWHSGRPLGRRLLARRAEAVSTLDRAAFGEDWWLDPAAIVDACRATPAARLRVAQVDGRDVGYAITGRAATSGYLQRLAVHPSAQGTGVGGLLVGDALAWLDRHHAVEVLVNTHVGNAPALALYRRAGFVEQPDRLVVLERAVP